MNVERLLLKLNPKTSSVRPRVDGERALITPSDVAAALNNLDDKYLLFLKYKTLRENIDFQALIRAVLLDATKLKAIRDSQQRLKKKGAITQMIVAALEEHKNSSLCKQCNGLGMIISPKKIVCTRCEGHGTQPRSHKGRSDLLGKDPRNYSRYWKVMYESIYSMLLEWDRRIIKHLQNNL